MASATSSSSRSTSTSGSESDDTKKDPDYVPSTEPSGSSDDEQGEQSEQSEDEEEIPEELLEKLTPLLMGFGSPFQMPMMVVIQGRDYSDEYPEDPEDPEDPEEDPEEESKGPRRPCRPRRPLRKRKRSVEDMAKILREYNREERSYIDQLPVEEKDKVLQTELRIRRLQTVGNGLPMRFKILESPMDDAAKRIILAKLEQFQRMHEGTGEYFKLRNWLNAANRLPLGRFKQLPVHADPTQPADVDKVADYLFSIKNTLDETVYGHREAKEQVLRILAQWISNPGSCGHCIGIQGPPGAGKTSLVKDGICKALDIPFSLISLGCYGSDGSALTGHHFTYEGATYGKISESLIRAQYMNPILYFDELDKISQTPKGEEVANVLIHLTDSTQNDHFSDSYFSEIPLDMSKCLIIFSYNDESLINPILKDRMITIRVNGYNKKEKLEIAQNYMIPRLLKSYNLQPDDIVFDNSILEDIIERVPPEEGVRNMKRGIDSIISWINMRRYVPNLTPSFSDKKDEPETPVKIELPIKITSQIVRKYLKNSDEAGMNKQLMASMYT